MSVQHLHIPMSFPLGCGYDEFTPGAYAYATGAETRFDYLGAGPLLVADRSGIASGYIPIVSKGGHLYHNAKDWMITTNGTNTKVYREESGSWALKETVNSAIATDMLSFKSVLGDTTIVVGYGSGTAFRFSTDDGSNWTASTKTSTTKNMNYGIVRVNNRNAAQVDYVVNPNIYYTAPGMTNAAGDASTAGATITDAGTDEVFTSLIEDDTGVVLIGMTFRLYSLNSAQTANVAVQIPFPKPSTEAGGVQFTGALSRENYANPVVGPDNAIYYHIDGGRDILRYDHGDLALVGPRHQGPNGRTNIPYLNLPVTAIGRAGSWMLCATGTSQFTSIRSFANEQYGTGNMLHNSNTSDPQGHVFIGQWNGESVVWHGSIIEQLTNGIWFDDANSVLYLGSDNNTTSQTRTYFSLTDPHLATTTFNGGSPASIQLAASPKLELGLISGSDATAWKTASKISFYTTGLTGTTTPTLRAVIWPLASTFTPAGTVDNAQFRPLYINDGRAAAKMTMPRMPWKKLYIELQMTNVTTAGSSKYVNVRSMDLEVYEAESVSVGSVL